MMHRFDFDLAVELLLVLAAVKVKHATGPRMLQPYLKQAGTGMKMSHLLGDVFHVFPVAYFATLWSILRA
jgi:hypothetical protein